MRKFQLMIAILMLACVSALGQGDGKIEDEHKYEISRNGKKFYVELKKPAEATITNEDGDTVRIFYSSGNFSVRLSNGWGHWSNNMKSAFDRAISLFEEAKSQRSQEEAYREMLDYFEEEGKEEK